MGYLFTMALTTRHGPTTHLHVIGSLYLRCVPRVLVASLAPGASSLLLLLLLLGLGSVRFCVPGTESERRTRYGGLRTDKLYGRPASWLFFQTGASEIARPDCPKDTGRIDPSHLTITTGRGPTSWPRTKRWPAASRAMSDVRQCRSPLCAGPQSGHRPYKSCRAGTRRDEYACVSGGWRDRVFLARRQPRACSGRRLRPTRWCPVPTPARRSSGAPEPLRNPVQALV